MTGDLAVTMDPQPNLAASSSSLGRVVVITCGCCEEMFRQWHLLLTLSPRILRAFFTLKLGEFHSSSMYFI